MFNRFLTLTTLVGATAFLSPVATASPNEGTLIAQNSNSVITTTSAQNEKLYLNRDKRYSYNLEVTRGGRFAGLNLPQGSVIRGEYVPAEEGLRYVANSVVVNGQTYNINARSEVLEPMKDPRDTSGGAVAEDAGIGAAGGVVIGEIFGDADAGEIIGGAAAGAAAGNLTADEVVVVEPDEPINLYQ
ncbi:MAG: hypothetical protein ACLFRN_07940 [Halothece sp.]